MNISISSIRGCHIIGIDDSNHHSLNMDFVNPVFSVSDMYTYLVYIFVDKYAHNHLNNRWGPENSHYHHHIPQHIFQLNQLQLVDIHQMYL